MEPFLSDGYARDITSTVSLSSGGSTGSTSQGPWVEISAALPFNISGIRINTASQQILGGYLSLGVGASGSEAVIYSMSNAVTGSGYLGSFEPHGWIPLNLSKGARLVARYQGFYYDTPMYVRFRFTAAAARTPTGFRNTKALSQFIAVPNGRGAWTEVIAAAPGDIRWMNITRMGYYDPSNVHVYFTFDLAIGAAGSEQMIAVLGTIIRPSTACALITSGPMNIPKGTRVAIRAWASGTTMTTVGYGLLYCF
jgi:hypothetical protein